MDYYKGLIRPVLFLQDPENARDRTGQFLKIASLWKLLSPLLTFCDPVLKVNIGSLKFPNPVGIAAGFDKNCEYIESLHYLGFGYITGGTVLEEQRSGNPKREAGSPRNKKNRLLRKTNDQSLVNAMGYPSHGVEKVAKRLARRRETGTPLVVSVSGKTHEEFLRVHARLEPLCDAVEINISSPNTPEMTNFWEIAKFSRLIEEIDSQRSKPIFVKLPPYREDDDQMKEKVLKIVNTCMRVGVDAVTAVNTYKTTEVGLTTTKRGLPGKPLFPLMLQAVKDIRAETGGKLPINACGGIFTAEDAWQALQAGATTVQLLTSFVFEGPAVAKKINVGLVERLKESDTRFLEDLNRRTETNEPVGLLSNPSSSPSTPSPSSR